MFLEKVLELLMRCRESGIQSKCYSFQDCIKNTEEVDKLFAELEKGFGEWECKKCGKKCSIDCDGTAFCEDCKIWELEATGEKG